MCPAAGDTYSVTTDRGSYRARSVVIAVGGRHVAVKPRFAADLNDEAEREGAPFLGSLRYSRLCEMTPRSPLSLDPYGPASAA